MQKRVAPNCTHSSLCAACPVTAKILITVIDFLLSYIEIIGPAKNREAKVGPTCDDPIRVPWAAVKPVVFGMVSGEIRVYCIVLRLSQNFLTAGPLMTRML